MISPETIVFSELPWLPLKARKHFPTEAAIYIAIDFLGQVQYIGRSINPKNRWRKHHRYQELVKSEGVRVAYMFVEPELLTETEEALINCFNPPLNSVLPNPVEKKPYRTHLRSFD